MAMHLKRSLKSMIWNTRPVMASHPQSAHMLFSHLFKQCVYLVHNFFVAALQLPRTCLFGPVNAMLFAYNEVPTFAVAK